jgi:hypothetical protein
LRYRLRTLLIALLVGPPLLAGAWLRVSTWLQQRAEKQLEQFRLPGSFLIEFYDPTTGRSDWEVVRRDQGLQRLTDQPQEPAIGH